MLLSVQVRVAAGVGIVNLVVYKGGGVYMMELEKLLKDFCFNGRIYKSFMKSSSRDSRGSR